MIKLTLGGLLALAGATAHASCGSAFCTLLNDRFALGTWDDAGLLLDVRLEAVTQNRLRSGTRTLSSADVTNEEAIERRTRNRNLVATLDYAFDPHWSLAVRAPVVDRDHVHDLFDPDTGSAGPTERWKFTRVGDVQVLGRWQPQEAQAQLAWALTAGFKLPTGSKSLVNTDGTRAERALQPGSGTADLVVGASLRRALGLADAITAQATLTQPLNMSEQFKPGRRIEVSAGWAHAVSPAWSTVLQVNAAHRARDRGGQAEPANSGSATVSISPGLSVAVTSSDTVYAFVPVPLYQRVNGIQLVARPSLAAGWTHAF